MDSTCATSCVSPTRQYSRFKYSQLEPAQGMVKWWDGCGCAFHVFNMQVSRPPYVTSEVDVFFHGLTGVVNLN